MQPAFKVVYLGRQFLVLRVRAKIGFGITQVHPQIKLPAFGDCPICGMDLVPLTASVGDGEERRLVMTEADKKLAEIVTLRVERHFIIKEIRMVGKVDYDETRMIDIAAWIPGRLDRLITRSRKTAT